MKVDSNNPVSRIAVFDMDETLGMFADLSEFTYTLARMLKHSRYEDFRSRPDDVIQYHFNELMDLYPEVLRPKIMDVMKFLVQMKNLHKCEHVMIYTNNTGPREWTEGIKNYFNFKSKFELFDRVIGAFKRPNGEVVEVKRTSHDKTYSDLVRCTNLEGNFEVFFVDDRAHPGMHTNNVYVIEVKPYERRMPQSVFIERFMRSPLFHSLGFSGQEPEFNKLLASSKRKTVPEYTDDEREVDLVVGDTILEKINWFFNPRHQHHQSQHHYNQVLPAAATATSTAATTVAHVSHVSSRKKSARRKSHSAGRSSASSAHRRTKRRGTGPSS